MFALTSLVPLIVIVAAAPAEAGQNSTEAAEAEHTRLAEEMRKLASRNAWRGVEAKYQAMLLLEKKGVQLTYDDHYLGAQSSRDLGRITDTYGRLRRALDRQKSQEAADWLSDIEKNYAPVDLIKSDRYVGEVMLTVDEMPMAPDQRAAIGLATEVIVSTGSYSGLLPFGTYVYGGKNFTVAPESEQVRIDLVPAVASRGGDDKSGAKRRDGMRVDVGALYTAVSASDAHGVRPEAFGGAGLRAGLGWEVELSKNVGMLAQAGYHGLMGGGGDDADAASFSGSDSDLSLTPATQDLGTALNLFYVWGGLSYWAGDLAIMAGPSWAGGRARSTGMVVNCDGEGDEEDGCDRVSPNTSAGAYTTSSIDGGFVKTGGGVLGLFYGFADMPGMKGARLGVSLYGGAQSDLATLYPWGQLAITIAPGL